MMKLVSLLVSTLLVACLEGSSVDTTESDEVTSTNEDLGPMCKKLEYYYDETDTRKISIFSAPRAVAVMHGARAPARAAAALLAAVLRHGLRYRRVRLRAGPRTLCDLASALPALHDNDADFNELVVHVGAEWTKQENTCEKLRICEDRDLCGAAGPRLNVMGPSAAPMTLRLHARLSPAAWDVSECTNASAWPFYANLSAVTLCGFKQDLPAGLQVQDDIPTTVQCSSTPQACIPVLVPPDWNTTYSTAEALAVRISATQIPLRIVPLSDEIALRRLLNDESLQNTSFLFMDYELWAGERDSKMRVLRVQSPPPEIELVEALRVADAFPLQQFAPRILEAFRHLEIYPHELRDVLDREARGLSIEEAACEHAVINNTSLDRFDVWRKGNEPQLWAYVMLCDGPDFNEYIELCKAVGNLTNMTTRLHANLHPVKCSDENDLNKRLIDMMRDLRYVRNVGVVGAGAGATASAAVAHTSEMQLVLYDVPPEGAKLGTAARAVAGRLEPLVRATQHFLGKNGWKRIAVISEMGSLARDFANLLAKDSALALSNKLISVNNEAAKALQSLREENARVFFINTGPDAASMILCEALRLKLTPGNGYAWIVREWRNASCDLGAMKHFTVSYWWRGGNDSALGTSGNAALRQKLDERWPGRTWPMLAAPLLDALMLLEYITKAGLQKYPSRQYDLHGINATRDFAEGFAQSRPPTGVVQPLRQSGFSLDAPLVFVDEWSGDTRRLRAVWCVNGSSVNILKELDDKSHSPPVWDGSRSFYTFCTSYAFMPTCHDGAVLTLVIVILLAPAALWLAARVRAARLAARDREVHVRLMARCERTAAALAGHLLDRRALQLHEELGAGHFGRVRRGTLNQPHGPPMPVAVKALREDAAPAEEAEFLREACALAALGGAHVVRLVGVCAADGPPLLLMEHALFGDLVKYLRERRYLAKLCDGDEEQATNATETEARYVGARELTRLAREASSALAHVARMRYVHRDVRAANCLIDYKRTLKLADFGMARSTGPKAREEHHAADTDDEDYLYICRRRGVFPVPWMAPESLQRGVFSAATDVWALGVLLLELATLGGRPFSSWRPPRVLRHVRAGGHPPLPRDASYHTREVIEMCWQRAAGSRPSAGAVCRYLAEHPAALRPALRPAWPDAAGDDQQGDSGFGERDTQLESDPHVSTL